MNASRKAHRTPLKGGRVRFKTLDDTKNLGSHAKRQIEAAFKHTLNNSTQHRSLGEKEQKTIETKSKKTTGTTKSVSTDKKKKTKPARVMRTADDLTYCPWPSTDPFVKVHQLLESRYGRYEDGGMLITEMVIDGGERSWRFDFALISPLEKTEICRSSKRGNADIHNRFIGHVHLLIEADGFGFHRSKEAFKDDRRKQTHALREGFLVKRITNEDVRERLDEVMQDIETILRQERLYNEQYTITPKGNTQSLFRWNKARTSPEEQSEFKQPKLLTQS